MKNIFLLIAGVFCSQGFSQAVVMNPGEGVGQLVILSANEMEGSEKFKSLSAYSIPVFTELPFELSVIGGAITLKQVNINSHIQLKSISRGTPNLDISKLEGGMQNPLLADFKDGDWIRMVLGTDGSILIEPSTEAKAIAFYESRQVAPVELKRNVEEARIFSSKDTAWTDADKVGSKAANYAELANALNTPEREVVRPSFAIPFYYYHQFLDENPEIKALIEKTLRDPLMKKIARVSYREAKLTEIQNRILAESSVINEQLINKLIETFDQVKDENGVPVNLKLRSSTNSEDLPNFNGAGLYTSQSYKPSKKGKEKKLDKKVESLKEALKVVWSSVWNLRAFDERNYFKIPHDQVSMGVQVNPSFGDELVDGVLVTKNVANEASLIGPGVYIESQRGDKHSVANPKPGVKPERVLVLINGETPLDKTAYQVHVLQKSNIADDMESVLPQDNPVPVMSEDEIKDLVYQSLKAKAHFKPLIGSEDEDFALDVEFKVDQSSGLGRSVYLKQARPYID